MAAFNQDWFERERLHMAAEEGDLVQIQALLEAGMSVNAFDDALSRTPLHYAAAAEQFAAVRALIKAGADVNMHEEDKIGDTALKFVAPKCSLEMAQLLVEAGADPTIPGWMSLTALDKSAKRNDPEGRKVHQLFVKTAQRCHPSWPRLKEFESVKLR